MTWNLPLIKDSRLQCPVRRLLCHPFCDTHGSTQNRDTRMAKWTHESCCGHRAIRTPDAFVPNFRTAKSRIHSHHPRSTYARPEL